MKVGNTPPMIPPGESGAPSSVEGTGKAGESRFSAMVEGASQPQTPRQGPSVAGNDPASLAEAVDSGQISPVEAVRRLVDHVLDAQLPPDATSEERSRVRALVEMSLESDPFLSGLAGRLGAGR